jgi:hypothetical protein
MFACTVILLLFVTDGMPLARAQPAIIESSLDRAYLGIQEAAGSGSNVSSLTDKFNLGLEFRRQAQDSDFRTCLSSDNCKAMASETFESVIYESSVLEQHSDEASHYRNILTYALFVPTIAFAASLCVACFLKVWRSYQIRKFLDMEISEKD